MCECIEPVKKFATDGCTSCWTCETCGKYGGCDSMAAKFEAQAERAWGWQRRAADTTTIAFTTSVPHAVDIMNTFRWNDDGSITGSFPETPRSEG